MKTTPKFFFLCNGQENFARNKVVVSMGVPWTMARLILYFEVLGTYLCFAGVMPFQNIHPVRSFIASTVYNRTVCKFLPRIFHCWIACIIFLTRSFQQIEMIIT